MFTATHKCKQTQSQKLFNIITTFNAQNSDMSKNYLTISNATDVVVRTDAMGQLMNKIKRRK